MHSVLLVVGFAIAWALGVALLATIPAGAIPRDGPGQLAWRLGCGWFVGAFLLTLWMRALVLMHVPFGVVAIGGPLAALTALFAWRAGRPQGTALRDVARQFTTGDLAGWQRALWIALLAWLALRFALLLGEVVWRPLYPWDAWTQWGTKARVWFELRTMAPFVTASEWLNATSPNVYFDAAPHYPATVPLLQVWAATLLGRWDDTLINLPWWLTGIAFGLAIYGYLAQEGFEPLLALLGTWVVLSLPILDVHIALAGYADLAMATFLAMAVLASLRWVRTRHWGDAGIALLLLIACVLIKNPGKIWVLIIVPGIIVALLPRYGLRIAAACFGVAAGVTVILARSDAVVLGYRLHLDFEMPWRSLFDAYFDLGSWHLLWYGVVATAVLAWRQLLTRALAPYTVIVAAGVTFLLFGFAFTNARAWVDDQSTVNRATLHIAPLIVVWMLMTFRQWAQQYSASRVGPARDAETGIAD